MAAPVPLVIPVIALPPLAAPERPSRRRDRAIGVRLSGPDRARVAAVAAYCGRTVHGYARAVLMASVHAVEAMAAGAIAPKGIVDPGE